MWWPGLIIYTLSAQILSAKNSHDIKPFHKKAQSQSIQNVWQLFLESHRKRSTLGIWRCFLSQWQPLSHISEARLLQFDQEWDEIARKIEEALFTQEDDQQPAPLQASGEIPILANPGQTTLLTDNPDLIWAIPFLEIVGQFLGHIPEHEGINKSGTQFSPSQVEDFLQTSSPVGISKLEKDDQRCSICMSEYVKERGDTKKPAVESEQRLLGEDAPENPIKLPCGHVFGEWCIKAWLLKQRASCPVCRFQFRPVRWVDSCSLDRNSLALH